MAMTEPIPIHRPEDPSPRRGGVLAIAAVVLALAALGLSAWTALRPARTPEPTYSAAQRDDAKVAICNAANVVRKGVSLNTNLQSPGGPGDVTGSLAVAANARLSLFQGGQYLIERLDRATPPEVADGVTKLAHTLMDIGAAATAGAQNTDDDQAARLRDADTENAQLSELCK
jgi:hypothetical protein